MNCPKYECKKQPDPNAQGGYCALHGLAMPGYKKVFVMHYDRGTAGMSETLIVPLSDEDKQRIAEATELEEAIKSFTGKQLQIYKCLDILMDELYNKGVDTSYFPHRARMVLVDYAKRLHEITPLHQDA